MFFGEHLTPPRIQMPFPGLVLKLDAVIKNEKAFIYSLTMRVHQQGPGKHSPTRIPQALMAGLF